MVVVLAALIFLPGGERIVRTDAVIFGGGIVLFVLGGMLVYSTMRQKTSGPLRILLILTGASAAGITVGALLHNLLYALGILMFGDGFWESIGLPDEPVFFIIALVICPIAYLVGSIGSIIYILRRKRREEDSTADVN